MKISENIRKLIANNFIAKFVLNGRLSSNYNIDTVDTAVTFIDLGTVIGLKGTATDRFGGLVAEDGLHFSKEGTKFSKP